MKREVRIITCVLLLAILLSSLSMQASALSGYYDSDWRYWSQGGSAIGGKMKTSGCYVVSQAKVLVESGVVANTDNFDPDTYANWTHDKGYFGDSKRSLSAYIGMQSGGDAAPQYYAKEHGKVLNYCGQLDISSMSRDQQCSKFMEWLNAGYYIIVGYTGHRLYILQADSIAAGTVKISNTQSTVANSKLAWADNQKRDPGRYIVADLNSWKTGTKLTYAILYSKTTKFLPDSDSSYYYGYVRGTNGALAINSKPITKTQIGRIEEGERCIVYPSKSTGKWYWVEYGDMSGYAYGKYISRTAPSEGPPPPPPVGLSVTVTTAPASNITETSAQLNGSLKISGGTGNITEHGAYLGTSTSNMTLAARDIVNYNKRSLTTYYSTSKYGTTLDPNTTYYYYCYAVVDGQTVKGDTVAFETLGEVPSAYVTTNAASNITETSAQLNGSLKISGGTGSITEHGAYLGTSTSNMTLAARDTVNYNKSSLTMFYNTSKYGTTLEPGTTYYYYCYAVVGGRTFTGSTVSFTTDSLETPQPEQPKPGPTWTGYVSGTNGALAINDRPAASPQYATQVGRIPEGASCTVYPNKTSGNWYWVEYGGDSGYAYSSYISSTPPTPPEPSGPVDSPPATRTGYISGTNGALAINDRPAASPKNSTQIGRIPEGASCTVYTDKGSGNWYWVEYNGVSGYAYGKYISLQ